MVLGFHGWLWESLGILGLPWVVFNDPVGMGGPKCSWVTLKVWVGLC